MTLSKLPIPVTPSGSFAPGRARCRWLPRWGAFKGIALAGLVLASVGVVAAAQNVIPRLEKRGEVTQLVVDGAPFLILGGELLNNSATSLDYLAPIWPRLRETHLNTALVAVSWAQLEPQEGTFDFSLVDGVIQQARAHDMRLVLLWFGSWKNTWSSYAPDWVKRDFERFPRVQLRNGSGTERLTPLSEASQQADARAFAAFMRRVKQLDAERHTVLMVQVENEVGVIPDARDHSPVANTAYAAAVPDALMSYLAGHRETLAPELRAKWLAAGFKTSGSWEEVFGPGLETEDLFMAWHYARYIGKVAEAGKAEYPLPMFTNAALIRPSYAPGQYNSGGPLPHSLDLWRAGGPQLDFLAPDIYFEFKTWADKFSRSGNPLFIPETHGGAVGAANVFYAIGACAAIGFCPFGIDRGPGPDLELAKSYSVIAQLAPLILAHQPEGRVAGVVLGELTPSQQIQLGDYTLAVGRSNPRAVPAGTPPPDADPVDPRGLFIATGLDEFYLAGGGLTITFMPKKPGPPLVGLATVEEGKFVDGRWVPGRRLAGDDTGQGNSISLRGLDRGIQRVTVYRYR
ncbi:DUF5597 domain-containing protein [Opitutus terrae]|uniref:Glycoside hydrolase family 42 domain protein n=1 Tax=Opitutus terrae (strain DSM 11246 / JCM 15787 / PB90-1) TaxID=452637 RepID=B1ZY94_OPITP|nr:DUF5597 domain-containing protein [Opitutus terrae]ACB76240.1 Glycoside hydrolase family 42 domain protein [Opitutus terrae PB90-1]